MKRPKRTKPGTVRGKPSSGLRSRPKRVGPRTAEQYFAKAGRFQDTWNRVNHVITKMRGDGISLNRAAREIGISPRTVVRWAKSALRKNRAGRFVAKKTDRLMRVLKALTPEGQRDIAVTDSRQASSLAEYWDAVQKYLESGDTSGLQKFRGRLIIDATGAKVPLLTDLNELNRLGSAGVLSSESLYARS
jgi:hypothetical protein